MKRRIGLVAFAGLSALFAMACGHGNANPAAGSTAEASPTPSALTQQSNSAAAISPEEQAPPASQTSGFDGQKAYDFTSKLVSFGPRPPESDASHRTQEYILTELRDFGCTVDTDDFHSPTPIGALAMKNIIAKVPGSGPGIILLLTHYDTLRLDNFVGAVDGGSSTGLMLEIARDYCGGAKKGPNAVWIAFLDGEEAQVVVNGVAQWTDTDSVYGSRELAARMAVAGDLKNVRAVILADMVGPKNLKIKREENSTPWLARLVWDTAARLHYTSYFVPETTQAIDDDHVPFKKRGVPVIDIIDLNDYPYWHTTQDTMDKVSPKSLAVVGQVIVDSVSELQQKFH
jgi:glutaminyl-peptide cyclotransferase